MALPLFGFADAMLQQLQTQWSAILNPIIKTTEGINATPPEVTILNSGVGIFKVPEDAFYLEIILIGGGGGGAASGTASIGSGTNGTNTTFGTSLLIGNGAQGGQSAGAGGTGGAVSLGGLAGVAVRGANGTGASLGQAANSAQLCGSPGGSTPLGGGGAGGPGGGAVGVPAAPNSGSGGGGASINGTAGSWTGSGGGAGGFVHVFITDKIQKTYNYNVGIKGTGGTAGTNGFAGGNAADGIIVVKTFFQ